MGGQPKRSPMKTTSDAARRWADALRTELEQWPGVVTKKAFGMTLVYREDVVFGALPGTRALFVEDALLIKFARETPALAKKIAASRCFAAGTMERQSRKKQGEGSKWRIYLLREDRDAREAVEWLARAYEIAGKR